MQVKGDFFCLFGFFVRIQASQCEYLNIFLDAKYVALI